MALAAVGILIIAFVAATGGAHGAWMLWIAVPFLMISLGYLFVISALVHVWGMGTSNETTEKQEDKPSKP